MFHLSGRFYITERYEEMDYKVGIYIEKDGKAYHFAVKVPKETLKPILLDNVEMAGLGVLPEKKEGQ